MLTHYHNSVSTLNWRTILRANLHTYYYTILFQSQYILSNIYRDQV